LHRSLACTTLRASLNASEASLVMLRVFELTSAIARGAAGMMVVYAYVFCCFGSVFFLLMFSLSV